jgi:hypothetical protein
MRGYKDERRTSQAKLRSMIQDSLRNSYSSSQNKKNEVVTVCDYLKKVKYSRVLPCAFTEYGALMLASVLNSPRTVEVSIYVVKVFVRLREMLSSHKDLSRKLEELELRIEDHDESIRSLVQAIRQLMAPHPGKNRQIGFQTHPSKNQTFSES